MKCDDALNGAAGLALDDLDPAGRAELESHLASCPDCRAAADHVRRTVAALRAEDPVEASPSRRDRVVAAMKAAGGVRIPRRRWIAASVAAALLLALTVPLLMSRGGLTVRRLDGAAWVQRAGRSEFVPLRLGDSVRFEDVVKTESVVGLEGRAGLKIFVNRNSQIEFDDRGRTPNLLLLEGAVVVDTPKRDLTVVDSMDRRATLRNGRFEVRLPIVASGSGEKKSGFVVHVEKGSALLAGPRGSREAKDGEAWSVEEKGEIRDEVPGTFAPWRKQP